MKLVEDENNHSCEKRYGKIRTVEIGTGNIAYCTSCHRKLLDSQIYKNKNIFKKNERRIKYNGY